METVSSEVANVNQRDRMNFAGNYVFEKTPNIVDLGLSPTHTTDKLKSLIGPATRAERWMDQSNLLLSRNSIT